MLALLRAVSAAEEALHDEIGTDANYTSAEHCVSINLRCNETCSAAMSVIANIFCMAYTLGKYVFHRDYCINGRGKNFTHFRSFSIKQLRCD